MKNEKKILVAELRRYRNLHASAGSGSERAGGQPETPLEGPSSMTQNEVASTGGIHNDNDNGNGSANVCGNSSSGIDISGGGGAVQGGGYCAEKLSELAVRKRLVDESLGLESGGGDCLLAHSLGGDY